MGCRVDRSAYSSVWQCILIGLYKPCLVLCDQSLLCSLPCCTFLQAGNSVSTLFWSLQQFRAILLQPVSYGGQWKRRIACHVQLGLRCFQRRRWGEVLKISSSPWLEPSLLLHDCGICSRMGSASNAEQTWFAALICNRRLLKAGSNCEGWLEKVRLVGRLEVQPFTRTIQKTLQLSL